MNIISGITSETPSAHCVLAVLELKQRIITTCLCPLFFIKFLFFTKWLPFKNYEKCFLFHLKSWFPSQDIQIFAVSHCLRGWSKKKTQVYDVINCLSKNVITHFVWYLEKEIRCDTKTLSIDRQLSKDHFNRKTMHNVHQKVAPNPFLILVNNPKQPLHARNSFKDKVFWKRIMKKH